MDPAFLEKVQRQIKKLDSYSKFSKKFKVNPNIFGEAIPILDLTKIKGHEAENIIKLQIRGYLKSAENPKKAWELITNNQKRLQKILQLEFIKDILLHQLFPKSLQTSSQPAISEEIERKIQKEKNEGYLSTLISTFDAGTTDQEKIELLNPWIKTTSEEIAGSPLPVLLEKEIENTKKNIERNILPRLENQSKTAIILVSMALPLFLNIKRWRENNIETPQNRIKAIKESFPNYDPNDEKWQKAHLQELRALAPESFLELHQKTKYKSSRKEENIIIIGESHQKHENLESQIHLLKKLAEKGFKILSLEEAEDTQWGAILSFEAQLQKDLSIKDILLAATIFSKKIEASPQQQGRLAKTLCLIVTARKLGYTITCSDVPKTEKARLQNERKYTRDRAIINGEPFNKNSPISALGGAEAFKLNILSSYKTSLTRSKHTANLLHNLYEKTKKEIGKEPKIIHIGGLLHTFDLQTELENKIGKRPIGIQLSYKNTTFPIADALGKLCPSESKFSLRIDTESHKKGIEDFIKKLKITDKEDFSP